MSEEEESDYPPHQFKMVILKKVSLMKMVLKVIGHKGTHWTLTGSVIQKSLPQINNKEIEPMNKLLEIQLEELETHRFVTSRSKKKVI